MLRVEVDGHPAAIAEIHRVATFNYGHFTSMQVRDRAVRGLQLHCARLHEASRELFGSVVEADHVKALVRHALGSSAAASVRVNVFSRPHLSRAPDGGVEPSIMVTVSDPAPDQAQVPWRVATMAYERELAHLKHVATMGLVYRRLLATGAGYDDALFFDHAGNVSEGSTWNIAFWDGATVILPEAAMLKGVTMQLLQLGLDQSGGQCQRRPVPVGDLRGFISAFALYSICPWQPISGVDDVAFGDDAGLGQVLDRAWGAVPWEPL